ncbi:MAG TPA: HAMP domain-containing protein [Streptosporangiaceae bacterium]
MRRRIALLVSAIMAVMLIAITVPLAFLLRELAADSAMTAATNTAQQISAVVATAVQRDLTQSVQQLSSGSPYLVSVFLPGGRAPIGDQAPRSAAVQLAQAGVSFVAQDAGGREVLIPVGGLSGGTAVVRVFVSNAELTKGVARAWLILALFGLVLLILGVLAADRLVGTVTRPISQLAAVSHRLAAGELDARADLTGVSEVREVATALNRLAGRIRELIWQERESIADLSHRLRTPLTALRLEAEAVPGSADPDGRLTAQVAALEQAVTSLIESARRRTGEPGSCDAAKVIGERTAFWSVLADDQERDMRLQLSPGPVLVAVAAPELAACMDALLGNVFAHTPEGTAFTVALQPRAGGGALVSVEDQGPGFPGGDPVRRGASGGGSTGLGLDIARQAADASGGSLTARTTTAGAQVLLELGPPAGPPQP